MLPRHARLQQRLLVALVNGSISNVAALAREVGVTRPAAARALRSLADSGLVTRHQRTWTLSAQGRVEVEQQSMANVASIHTAIERQLRMQRDVGSGLAQAARTDLSAALGDSMRLSEQMAAMPDLSAAMRLSEGAAARLSEQMAAMPDLSAAMRLSEGTAARLSEQMAAMPDLGAAMQIIDSVSAADLFAGARASVHDSLSAQLSALAGPPQWWSPMLAENLTATSRIAADLAAMTNASVVMAAPTSGAASTLEGVVGRVLDAHSRHLSASIAELVGSSIRPSVATTIALPTRTTAVFTGTAREAVVPSQGSPDRADFLREAVHALAADLESLGAPVAAKDLRDAWKVVQRRPPGWSKTGAHLIREVLRGVLDELAPADRVPPDVTGHKTKRTQVLWIVGGSPTLADWVDATTSNIGKLHSLLSAEAKNSGRPRVREQGLLGLLQVAMGVVTMLVEQASEHRL